MTARPRSAHRELTDFLVMALTVVFLVRTFVGEPFGVPTGSMAPALLGAHKLIHCPECDKTFPVGSDENSGEAVVCLCPACGTKLDIAAAPVKAGSRIVVMKGPPTPLKRWDVAVFKFVDEPRKFYVKRIIGLPGDHLRIRGGEIEIWNEEEQHWLIARKPAELAKELAIPVWEEEYRARDTAWYVDAQRYIFNMKTRNGRLGLGGDSLAYNLGLPATQASNANSYWNRASNPVGDLHVSFTVESSTATPWVKVEISKGNARACLRASRFEWGLYFNDKKKCFRRPECSPSTFRVHFAFVDQRLAAWCDEKLLLEQDVDDSTDDRYPDLDDLSPIVINVGDSKNRLNDSKIEIKNLRVYRDIYYTQQAGATDFLQTDAGQDMMADVKEFKRFREARRRTTEFTVPAGSYFALGDNSDRSLDGRHWKHSHFVDERMIVGKVLFKLGR